MIYKYVKNQGRIEVHPVKHLMIPAPQPVINKKIDAALAVAKLKSLPYQDYLKTEHWKILRRRLIKKSRGVCAICGVKCKRIMQLHHKTYVRLGEERPSDMMVLCPNCHRKVHGII